MAKRGRKKYPVEQLRITPIASFRLEKAELSEIERLAKQNGQSRSDYLRSIVRDVLATQKEKDGKNE